MLLYRLAPEGSYAAAEPAADHARILLSDPFATPAGSWVLGPPVPLSGTALLAPVRPSKIVGIGRNYVDHAKELDHPMPSEPLLFFKATSALIGPEAPIVLPPESSRVEHEGEVAVVVGRRLRRGCSLEEVRDAILGITCGNDVTARDLQKRDATFARAKGFDTFCPVGPAIWVGADLDGLEVMTRVNGVERQRGRVRDMAFPILDLLLYTARIMTLEPGDLILTGTPAGVGPLLDGDRVEVEIPGVGVLGNPIEAGRGAP
jgi:2-keto-4-pentenoate hydratase/2-oxohepta-3-ene-1,7-dioic acid hydratase in catechol pathway